MHEVSRLIFEQEIAILSQLTDEEKEGRELNRDEAEKLMFEYTKSDALRKHMFAVEAAMRAYARKFGEEEDKWGVVGLLHDFDYEAYPNAPDHPLKGSEILEQKGYPEDVRKAILGHAAYTAVPRDTRMAKVLYACDELCGFVNAVSLVRPNKIVDLEAPSIKKKLKDKAFAKNINREDIRQGAAELGVDLTVHIQVVIDAMKEIGDALGLNPAPKP